MSGSWLWDFNAALSQNFDLQRKARSVQTYRDEVDALKELAIKGEKYDKDVARYKEKINELDFYKSRVEVSLSRYPHM